MRISSNTIFDSNVAALGQQQSRLVQTQQQIASGKRLLNSATDPVAFTQALTVTQADAINTQQTANRGAARDPISIAESTLQSVTTLIQNAQTGLINAGNGSLNASDRATLATDLNGRLQELIGLANNKDAAGNYLFSGFQSATQPFVATPAGVSYFGDNGQRLMQVSAGRQIPTSDSGADVFMRIKNGNGTFVTQANSVPAQNTGTGTINAGSVTNPALLTGNNYTINFSIPPGNNGTMTYTVNNLTTGLPVTGQVAQPYVSGQAISFDGMQMNVQGVPNSGDSFTVAPSTNVSLFKTISDMVATLNSTATGSSLTNSLNTGMANLNSALSTVLNTRANLGLRLNELDSLQVTGDNMSSQLKQSLSALQDTNVTQAISDLTMQQTTLQAAQKSFIQVANLSMFTYM